MNRLNMATAGGVLLLMLLGAGSASAAPAAYVPVYASGGVRLQQQPSNFTFTTTPAGGTYRVTTAHWQGWGSEHALGQVSGYFTCNQQPGVCDGFTATLRLSSLRTDSKCGVRIYGHMQVRASSQGRSWELPGNVPQSGWKCPPPHGVVAGQCPEVAIFGLRGSGEEYKKANHGMGKVVYPAYNAIRQRLHGNTVVGYGVHYDAVSVTKWATLFNFRFNEYSNSVVVGGDLLVNGGKGVPGMAQVVAECPNVKLVLIGWSQGAHTIRYALAVSRSWKEVVTRHIAAVILFGDPVRKPIQSYNVGPRYAEGIFAQLLNLPGNDGPPGLPAHFYDRTRSYCAMWDPICDPPTPLSSIPYALVPDAVAFAFQNVVNGKVHESYSEPKYLDQATNFVVQRLNVKQVEPKRG